MLYCPIDNEINLEEESDGLNWKIKNLAHPCGGATRPLHDVLLFVQCKDALICLNLLSSKCLQIGNQLSCVANTQCMTELEIN